MSGVFHGWFFLLQYGGLFLLITAVLCSLSIVSVTSDLGTKPPL